MPTPLTLPDALDAVADTTTDGLIFVDRHEREVSHPWAQIVDRARRVAGGLLALGLQPGETVAIVLPTGPAFFDAFFGCHYAGVIPVPLYPPVRLGRLDDYHDRTAAMLTAARARLVLTDGKIWPLLGESARRARPDLGCRRVEEVVGAPATRPAARPLSPQDIALVQFSSGTTVAPKPVALPHAALIANTTAILDVITRLPGYHPHGVSWLPLYHDMGLIGCVLPALLHPGSLTLLGPELFIAKPALWLRALSRRRAVVSPAPNFAYALCVERIRDEELDGVDLSHWQLALNGAEPVAPDTLRRFLTRFAAWGLRPSALTPVYGLAEATLAVTFSASDTPFLTTRFSRAALAEGRVEVAVAGEGSSGEGSSGEGSVESGVELVSVGAPLQGIAVDAPTGHIGPVRVRGPSVMAGYLFQPELTAAALQDGWLDTGDLGFFHDGQLYITGRKKDVLVLRGRKYAPHAVEQAVDRVEGVRTGCAAAASYLPEGADTERLAVWVELKEGEAPTPAREAALREAILGATTLLADDVVQLAPGTLPRTSSGKIRRAEALRQWRAGQLAPPAPVNTLRVLGAMASGVLAHARRKIEGES